MACCNHWTSPFHVGSHELARQFAALGYEVAFVSDPLTPLHFLPHAGPLVRERFRLYRSGGLRAEGGRLRAFVPGALLAPHRSAILRSGIVHRTWQRTTCPGIIGTIRRAGFGDVDLLYLDSEIQAFWLGAVRHRRSVFRITDRKEGFRKTTPAAIAMRAELAREVDLVVYAGKSMEPAVRSLAPKRMRHLANGVDYEFFAGNRDPRPVEYDALDGPIAVYAGALDYWFDFDALDLAAASLPRVAFVLVGGTGTRPGALRPRANVHYLGPRPFERMPAYLRWADVGVIPNDVRRFPELVNHMNPLKLHQYMASGLPVVAVRSAEMEALESPAVLYGEPAEFPAALASALGDRARRGLSQAYARGQDWSIRAKELLSELEA